MRVFKNENESYTVYVGNQGSYDKHHFETREETLKFVKQEIERKNIIHKTAQAYMKEAGPA